MTTYRSEIKLGERYRDKSTGFEGVCVALVFFQHGCERPTLKGFNRNREIVEYSFDAPELERIDGQQVKLLERKTGGPHDRTPARR